MFFNYYSSMVGGSCTGDTADAWPIGDGGGVVVVISDVGNGGGSSSRRRGRAGVGGVGLFRGNRLGNLQQAKNKD